MSEIITDISFDLTRTKDYILSIQVSLDGFYFSVIHKDNNQLLALGNYPAIISSEKFLGRRFFEWASSEQYFNNIFSEARLIYYTGRVTLVPGDYYDYNHQDDILNLIFGKTAGFSSHDNYWPDNKCNLIFSIPDSFLNPAVQKFQDLKIIHPLSVLNLKAREYIQNNNNIFVLYLENKGFSHLLYYNNTLVSVNSYNIQTIDDVIYFVLSILKQNNINPRETKFFIAGDTAERKELDARLKQYAHSTQSFKPITKINTEIFSISLDPYINLI